MSTTRNLRKEPEALDLPLAADGLSDQQLAIATGGDSIRIVCDDHKVIGTRPN